MRNFQDHFSAVAADYASCRPRYPAALFDHLATLVPASTVVWDCAAGNGQATADLAARFARVIATDASPEQIAGAPKLANVDWRVASAERSGLPDHSVDLITVGQALHWFDLSTFYTEVRRVLAPGGVLAVWCYGINEVEGAEVNRLVRNFYATTVGPYWPPERAAIENGYRSLPFPFRELPTPACVMEVRWNLSQLIGYLGTWSATNRYRAATGQDPLGPLRAAAAAVWGDVKLPRKVVWPLAIRIGRAD